MSRKSDHRVTELFSGGMPAPNLRETLVPFADSVPWPVIVVDEPGNVMYLNSAMRASYPEARPPLSYVFPGNPDPDAVDDGVFDAELRSQFSGFLV